MDEKLLTISEAADFLNVAPMTLRRWDESGKLVALRKEGGTHRYYRKRDLELFKSDLKKLAHDWVLENASIPDQYYCANSSVFLARLSSFETKLMKKPGLERLFSLIVSVVGEIGNNSFDHNIGKWPNEPGIFFGYDIGKGIVVLADRGLGVFQTLKQIRPDISNHVEALRVAFTEIISGRSPERRGNGLKFVREVVTGNPISLFFTSGDAELRLQESQKELQITRSSILTRGCYASLEF
ncbi:MAG TPA: helix-turn-helix domain-containing protein [Candidatus Peribacteraceae bacterium]|nr:helix-turn-helix domain-containing protein [Candidatus Peribacteraceae bacterium]